jgi:uncharacterized protein
MPNFSSPPEHPWFLFAPGAGAPASSEWMQAWSRRLEVLAPVFTFDYLYRQRGSSRPDPLPLLIETHREALRAGRQKFGDPAILIGKSMGGRVSCHVASLEPCRAVVCLGYPLRGTNGKLRDEALLACPAPILFVQGTRDPLCDLGELESVLAARKFRSELMVVESGDHSLKPTRTYLKNAAQTEDAVENGILERIRAFTRSLESR